MGRAFDRPIFRGAGRRRRGWPTSWPGSGRSNCLAAEEAALPPTPLNGRLLVTRRPAWAFAREDGAAKRSANISARASLEGFGFDDDDGPAIRAAGAILDYLVETQKSSLGHIDRLVPLPHGDDAGDRRSDAPQPGDHAHDARRPPRRLAALRSSIAPSRRWARDCLADWIANPLVDLGGDRRPARCRRRTGRERSARRASCASSLRQVYDVERLLARVTTGRARPRDLSFLGRTLRGPAGRQSQAHGPRQRAARTSSKPQLDLVSRSASAARTRRSTTNARWSAKDGGFIRAGLRAASSTSSANSPAAASSGSPAIRPTEAERTGHPEPQGRLQQGLRLLHRGHEHAPRQGAAELHPQADGQERRALHHAGAEGVRRESPHGRASRRKDLEYELFLKLREQAAAAARRLHDDGRRAGRARRAGGAGRAWPASAATAGRRSSTSRCWRSSTAGIRCSTSTLPQGHVRAERRGAWAPTTARSCSSPARTWRARARTSARRRCSRSWRRSAASCRRKEATIGVADRIFARVGASDELSRGQSTFMVEMTETARILNTRDGAQPGDPRRDRPRHEHLRRRLAGLGDRRAPARPRRLPHALRHALSRADRPARHRSPACGT